MGNDLVVKRPPLPSIGKITGLGPGMSKIREGMGSLRERHDGLNDDIQAYGMALDAVRDHVRNLHEDLAFEVKSEGNGAGGQVSQEQLEKRVTELSGTDKQEIQTEEVGDAAPLTSDPAAAPGSGN